MNVGRNPLQVSSLLPQSAMAKLLKRLVSVVLVLVSVSVTQISSEKVARATYDSSALVLILDTTKASMTVQLPITSITSAITIVWGDGSSESSTTSYQTHTYASHGTYTVVVTGGAFSRFGGVTSNQAVFTAVQQWGTYQPTSMQGAFVGWVNLTSVPTIIPSSVTNMQAMFLGASAFNGSIGSWNTANVTNMYAMFKNASAFNQPVNTSTVSGVTYWDTSKVTNMREMFYGASAFNQPVDSWVTSKVTNMQFMFFDARAFNQPVNTSTVLGVTYWDTSKVQTISHMFRGALAFNQPVNLWDTSSMSNMSNAFQYATAFNQPVNSWNTSNVTLMNHMFAGASTFNQPVNTNTSTVLGVTYWDTSKVTNMSTMFSGA